MLICEIARNMFAPSETAGLFSRWVHRIAQFRNEAVGLSDIHLSNEQPCILGRASTKKVKKEARIPLHPVLVDELLLVMPAEGDSIDALPVFPDDIPCNQIYRKDWERARAPYVDYFATMLATNGVS